MNKLIKYVICLSAIATLAFAMLPGGAVAQGKAKPSVYVVNEIEVTDEALFRVYSSSQQPFIEKHGGRYIIRGGNITAIDGTPPKRFTNYVFDNMEKMLAWQNDPGAEGDMGNA